MATQYLVQLALSGSLSARVLRSTADGTSQVVLDQEGRSAYTFTANRGTGLSLAMNAISLAAAATSADIDLTAMVDAETGLTIAFANIVAVILVCDNNDGTAQLVGSKGAANGWDAIATGWTLLASGLNSVGGGLPAMQLNNAAGLATWKWTVDGTHKTIKIVANTPQTATTVTGRLIVVGYQ